MNGRIQLDESQPNVPFHLYEKVSVNTPVNYRIPDRGESSMVAKVFFHGKNINTIQNNIIAKIHEMSHKRYIIDRQNPDALFMIMKSIYNQHGLNLRDNVTEQVEILNNIVTNECVPKIWSELTSYIKYKHDISNLATPMPRPISTYLDKVLSYNKPMTWNAPQ